MGLGRWHKALSPCCPICKMGVQVSVARSCCGVKRKLMGVKQAPTAPVVVIPVHSLLTVSQRVEAAVQQRGGGFDFKLRRNHLNLQVPEESCFL